MFEWKINKRNHPFPTVRNFTQTTLNVVFCGNFTEQRSYCTKIYCFSTAMFSHLAKFYIGSILQNGALLLGFDFFRRRFMGGIEFPVKSKIPIN